MPQWLDEFYPYSVSESFYIIDHYQVNMNVLTPKTGALHIGPQKQNDLFKMAQMIVIKFQ